jgi:hypothetical protein
MYPVLKHWEDDTTELEIKIITNYIWISSYPKSNLVSDVAVIRRSTNKTMVKRKMTKLQTTIYNLLQRKLKIEQQEHRCVSYQDILDRR